MVQIAVSREAKNCFEKRESYFNPEQGRSWTGDVCVMLDRKLRMRETRSEEQPWKGFPWVTPVLGSGCLEIVDVPAFDGVAIKTRVFDKVLSLADGERLAREQYFSGRVLSLGPGLTGDADGTSDRVEAKLAGDFALALVRARTRPASAGDAASESGKVSPEVAEGPSERDPVLEDAESVAVSPEAARLVLVSALLTRFYFLAKAEMSVPVDRWAVDEVAFSSVAKSSPDDLADLARFHISQLIATLSNPDGRQFPRRVNHAVTTLLSSISERIASRDGKPRRLTLADLRLVTQTSWHLLTQDTGIYPGWADLLLGLAMRDRAQTFDHARPRPTKLLLLQRELPELLEEPTKQSWNEHKAHSARRTLYDAVADVLFSEAKAVMDAEKLAGRFAEALAGLAVRGHEVSSVAELATLFKESGAGPSQEKIAERIADALAGVSAEVQSVSSVRRLAGIFGEVRAGISAQQTNEASDEGGAPRNAQDRALQLAESLCLRFADALDDQSVDALGVAFTVAKHEPSKRAQVVLSGDTSAELSAEQRAVLWSEVLSALSAEVQALHSSYVQGPLSRTALGAPPACAFVTSLDLELEMALWRKATVGQEFYVVVPVSIFFDDDSSSARPGWLRGTVQRSTEDTVTGLEQLRNPTDWVFMNPRFDLKKLTDGPHVVRLSGAPLIRLPDLHAVAGMAEALTSLRRFRVDSEGNALTRVVIDHAVTLDEHFAMRQAEAELLQKAANRLDSVPDSFLPLPLVSSTKTADGRPGLLRRFWMCLGVAVDDPAVRFRLISQISPRLVLADLKQQQPQHSPQRIAAGPTSGTGLLGLGGSDAEPSATREQELWGRAPDGDDVIGQDTDDVMTAPAGVVVNTRIHDDDAAVLFWAGFDVVRDDADKFKDDLGHYAEHVRKGGPIRWLEPRDADSCGIGRTE